jgi:hypothetical protein
MGHLLVLRLWSRYSAPPFKFNHRGLGELAAASCMNVLLPHFAALVNTPPDTSGFDPYRPFDLRLAVLVVPSAFLKVALFLVRAT